MKKVLFITTFLCFTLTSFSQNLKKIKRIYGGIPTVNENMKWEEKETSNEYYTGVIQVNPEIKAPQIIEAFMSTFQSIQDANIMTKQMRNNNAWGGTLSAMKGDYKSMTEFTKSGDSKTRMQNQKQNSWTVQFIDGVRISRFYYNISVKTKDGRYKLTATPTGLSGYANDHIQNEWSDLFKNGKVRKSRLKYYNQMKIKLAYTINQWIEKVEKHLNNNEKNDW